MWCTPFAWHWPSTFFNVTFIREGKQPKTTMFLAGWQFFIWMLFASLTTRIIYAFRLFDKNLFTPKRWGITKLFWQFWTASAYTCTHTIPFDQKYISAIAFAQYLCPWKIDSKLWIYYSITIPHHRCCSFKSLSYLRFNFVFHWINWNLFA